MAYKGLVIRDAVKITTFYSFFCRHYENTYRFLGETHNFWECVLVRKGEISVSADERIYHLKENEMMLVGIAPAPYDWNMGEECRAYVIEDVEPHDLYWCHGAKSWVDVMRDQMEECWNELGG